MVHAAEGTLQAYLDGEIDSAAAAALSDHVAGCDACAGELRALRRANSHVAEALALLDVPAPVLAARAGLVRERTRRRRDVARIGSLSLAKAAMLLLVLAGAGAAAIPDVRRVLETSFARVAHLFTGTEERAAVAPGAPEPAAPPAPAAETSVSYVAPAAGRVRVVVHEPTGRLEVVVRLIEGPRVRVETATSDGGVRRRSGTGRLELMGLGSGTVTIGVPRAVQSASIELGDAVRVYKNGDELRASGPGAEGRGSEVRLIVGS